MSVEAKTPKQRIVRDKDFARRLDIAVSGHPLAPEGHGRQKWLRERVEGRFKIKLSPEGVRKWFAGESRPRPSTMSQIAQALEVDEAWLSIGITPTSTPEHKRQQNNVVSGAVNLLAGLIQMNKGHSVFPEGASETVDLYGIIGGSQKSFVVRHIHQTEGQVKITVPTEHERSVVTIVAQETPVAFTLLRLPTDNIGRHGVRQGGYFEIEIDYNGQNYRSGGEVLPLIRSFNNLDGEMPARR